MLKNLAEGYKPQVDWGGGSGDAALVVGGQQVRLVAWRKKLLYALLGILVVMAVTNFMATLWVLSRISFNTEGLGPLHVEVGGVQLWGRAWLEGTMNTKDIRSRPDSDLGFIGYHNTSLYGLGDDGLPVTAMIMDTRDVNILANSLNVTDNSGREIFFTDANGSRTGANSLNVTGSEGAVLDQSAQTPLLLAQPDQQLEVESSTRSVHMFGGHVMGVEARDGDISANCLNTLSFTTKEGSIRFMTPNVYMADLPLHGKNHPPASRHSVPLQDVLTTRTPETQIVPPIEADLLQPTTPLPRLKPDHTFPRDSVDVYQVCVCPSGRIFLAPASSICVHDAITCR